MDENNETAVVKLLNPSSGSIGTNATHTLTITDDDDPPTVSWSLSNSATTDETATAYNIPLQLSAPSGKGVTLTITATGTATNTTDYVASGLSVTFPACNSAPASCTGTYSSQNVTVTPVVDATAEGNETVVLTSGTPTGATLGAITSHTLTITDDDGTPQLSVSNVSFTEGNSGSASATITVTLAGSHASGVSVNYATANGTAVAGTCGSAGVDYQTASGTLNWGAGQTGTRTFSVPVCGETLAETNETVQLNLSGATNSNILISSALLTISNDDTSLIISSAETLDCDPVDGILDHYKITFNKNVTDASHSGQSDNVEGATTATWTVAGRSNLRIDHGGALNGICGTDNANDSVIYLKFDQGSSVDTGVIPELTATAESLSATDGSGKLYYNSGNVASPDIAETDKAAPFIWYALATNVGGTNGQAGTGDTLTLQYSERTNAVSLSGTDLDDIFTLNNSHNLGASADITSAVWSASNVTNDTLTVTFATNIATIYDGDTIKASGTLVQDIAGNSPANVVNVLSPAIITGTFDSGPVGPVVTDASYFDTDGNGKIDHVRVTFSKLINDASFPGSAGAGLLGNVTTTWTVAGYSNLKIDERTTINGISNPANDSVVWIAFSEGSSYDTGAKPDLKATLGQAGLKDNIDSCYINATPTANCTNASLAELTTTQVSEKDAAAPLVVSASARAGAKYVFLFFSENVWGAQNMPACTAGGQMKTASFSYNNVNTGGATGIASADATDDCAATDAFARMLADNLFTSADLGSDKTGPASNQIYDAANNSALTTQQTIQATVSPYVITASSFKSGAKYFFRIVFSEPMDYTTATNASNYTLSEDVATACADIGSVPKSVSPLSNTIFDLESDTQCGVGNTNATTYKIQASANILDVNEIEPVGSPNTATSAGTGNDAGNDLTKPSLLQAIALDSTHVQITYSEPMKSTDITGSAQCNDGYTNGVTCGADIDGAGGIQLKYAFTPGLGNVKGVSTTAFNSVYVVESQNNQTGSFYTITAYAGTVTNQVPQDLAGNTLSSVPSNQATFQGLGSAITNFTDGALFTDPFADNTTFAYAFSYGPLIYLGPNQTNNGAFRFEADGTNPVGVTFLTTGGTSCTPATGFGVSGGTCGAQTLGPNGEDGIVGFNAGTVTVDSANYDVLMVGPTRSAGVSKAYYTQDIDTQLDWKQCSLSLTGGANSTSLQTNYAWGDSMWVGLASDHGTQAPQLNRFAFTQSGGVLSCGSATNIGSTITGKNYFGMGAANKTKPVHAVLGGVASIDSMFYSGTGTVTPTNTFYMANAGGVVATADSASSLNTVICQKFGTGNSSSENCPAGNSPGTWSGTNLTLMVNTMGKIRPGQRAVPFIVYYDNALYMARNLASSYSSIANATTNAGAEIYKCSANCTTGTNWTKVADIRNATTFTNAGKGGSNNLSISMLAVNGSNLYVGVDNTTDGVGIFRATSGVTSESSFSQIGDYGFTNPSSFRYIFSHASKSKSGKHFIYVTTGTSTDAIKVLRQQD